MKVVVFLIYDRKRCRIDVFSPQESEGSEKGLRRKRHRSHSPSIPSKSDSSESETKKTKRKKNKKKRGRSHSVCINDIELYRRKYSYFIMFFLIFFYSVPIPVFHLPRNPRKGNGKRRSTEGLRFTAKVPLRKIMNLTRAFPKTSWRNRGRNSCASCNCNKKRTENFVMCYYVLEMPSKNLKQILIFLMTTVSLSFLEEMSSSSLLGHIYYFKKRECIMKNEYIMIQILIRSISKEKDRKFEICIYIHVGEHARTHLFKSGSSYITYSGLPPHR